MQRVRRSGSMLSRLVAALRLVAMLAFVLANVASHGAARAANALDCLSFQVHAVGVETTPHHAASCTLHDLGVKGGSCCLVGQCMLGILWPPSPPLPPPKPPLLARSPGLTLVGAEPQTPYRPPA